MQKTIIDAKFKLGTIVATHTVMAHINDDAKILFSYLTRHATGDWGDICKEDKKVNNEALKNANRILSAYNLPDGKKIWIITEWDRSVTTVLFPEDY